MKTQITSILLCALLSSTLCHEYLSARHIANEARSSKHLSHFQARDAATPQQCEWVCNSSSNNNVTGGLQIIVNETTSLVGIVNVTANVAIVIDIHANLVAIFNGNSGAVIIVNIDTGSGVYIAAGQSTSVWLSANTSFEVYFTSLTSLQVILDLKVGTKFDTSTVTSEILVILGNMLGHLSYQLSLEIQGNIKASLTIFVKISSSLSVALKGILKLFVQVQGLIHIRGDILWLISVCQGLGAFFSEVNGGLAALIAAKVEIDIALLLAASNGIELLVNLLLAMAARVDLSIVSGLLNSSSKLLVVIVQLGGNVSGGLSGIFKVITNIVALINGSVTIDIVIVSLMEYAASGSSDIEIFDYTEGFLKVIEIQSSVYSSTQLSAFILFVQNLQNGKWVVGGINMSAIITILLRGSVNGALLLVVTVLLRLTAVIKVSIAISSLLYNLLLLLQTNVGIHLLQQIIFGLSINFDISAGGNFLVQLFSKINVSIILGFITRGLGIEVILKAIPVMGPICVSLSGVVQTASNGSVSLTTILQSSEAHSVIIQIETLIKSSVNVSVSTGEPKTTATTEPGGGWTIGGGGGANGSWTIGGGITGGTNGSGSIGGSWGIGGRHHGHHKHEKSGYVSSHNNKLQEKNHQREHYQSN